MPDQDPSSQPRPPQGERQNLPEQAVVQALLDALDVQAVVIDLQGQITAVNRQWLQFAAENGVSDPLSTVVNVNYLAVVQRAAEGGDASATQALQGLRQVLDGSRPSYRLDYPCDTPTHPYWFSMKASRLPPPLAGLLILHEDITPARRAAEDLRLKSAALDAAANGMLITDLHGSIQWVNPAWMALTGYTFEEAIGQNPRILKSGAYDQAYYQKMWGEILAGRVWHAEMLNRRKDGSLFYEDVTIAPVRSACGEIAHFVGIKQDITARKQAEQALQASEAKFANIFRHNPLPSAILDPDSCYVDVNRAFCELAGLPREALLGQHVGALGNLDAPTVQHLRQTVLESGGTVSNLEVVFHVNGRPELHALYSTSPIDLNGVPHHLLVLQDVTARKQAEQALAKSAALLSEAQRIGRMGHFEWIGPSPSIALSEEMYNLFELPREQREVTTLFLAGRLAPEESRRLRELDLQAFASQTPLMDYEYCLNLPGGRQRWVRQHTQLEYGPDGKPARMLGVVQDISNEKQAQTELQQRTLDLELINLLNEAANQGSELREITDLITRELCRLFHALGATFSLVSADGQTLEMQSACMPFQYIAMVERLIGQGFSRLRFSMSTTAEIDRILQKQHGNILNTAEEIQTWMSAYAAAVEIAEPLRQLVITSVPLVCRQLNIQSLMRLPLVYSGEVIGLVDLYGERAFSPADLARLQALVGQLTAVVLRKRSEEAKRASEEIYRGLLESLDSIVAMLDPDGRILYVNDVGTRTWQSSPAGLTGRQIEVLFPEAEALRLLLHLVLSQNRGLVGQTLLSVQHKPTWFRIALQPIHNQQGEVVSILLNATNIHELKTAQQELLEVNRTLEERVKERTAQVQDLYNNAPAGYHSLDAAGNYLEINQTELNWLGYTRAELLGRPFTTLLLPEQTAIFAEYYARARAEGGISDLELEVVRRDGSRFTAMLNSAVVFDAAGKFISTRSTLVNISARKQAEEELRASQRLLQQANLELEHAMRVKDSFLANMSHELRTPLTAILGMSESLLDEVGGPLSSVQQRGLQLIQVSGQHLLTLINDILDLSKIEAGKLDLQPEMVAVEEICQASLAFVKEPALKKQIRLGLRCSPATLSMVVDPLRLKQILVNLLSNAVKFTPAGGRVDLEVEGRAAERQVAFTVQDNGIGISAEDLPRLFVPFSQADSSLTRSHEGTGLGLSLVKKLAEMHGGSVSVISQPGQGSRFSVILPWHEAPGQAAVGLGAALPAEAAAPAPAERPVRHILLAEDNEINAEVIMQFLSSKGYLVSRAINGVEALNLLDDLQPDLILMDIQMPEIDGLEATQLIRQQPAYARLPIVALTALAMKSDIERCLQAGANEYLSKPVHLTEMVAMIERLLG